MSSKAEDLFGHEFTRYEYEGRVIAHFADVGRVAADVLVGADGPARGSAASGSLTTIRPGDTIYAPPGEWHWHGAAPTTS